MTEPFLCQHASRHTQFFFPQRTCTKYRQCSCQDRANRDQDIKTREYLGEMGLGLKTNLEYYDTRIQITGFISIC